MIEKIYRSAKDQVLVLKLRDVQMGCESRILVSKSYIMCYHLNRGNMYSNINSMDL